MFYFAALERKFVSCLCVCLSRICYVSLTCVFFWSLVQLFYFSWLLSPTCLYLIVHVIWFSLVGSFVVTSAVAYDNPLIYCFLKGRVLFSISTVCPNNKFFLGSTLMASSQIMFSHCLPRSILHSPWPHTHVFCLLYCGIVCNFLCKEKAYFISSHFPVWPWRSSQPQMIFIILPPLYKRSVSCFCTPSSYYILVNVYGFLLAHVF